jgi:uncharacterized Zn-finger protein
MPDITPSPTEPVSIAEAPLNQASQTGAGMPFETLYVDAPVIACDGGDGALGHPRVWLRIVSHAIICPYCSRRYVLNEGVAPDSGH